MWVWKKKLTPSWNFSLFSSTLYAWVHLRMLIEIYGECYRKIFSSLGIIYIGPTIGEQKKYISRQITVKLPNVEFNPLIQQTKPDMVWVGWMGLRARSKLVSRDFEVLRPKLSPCIGLGPYMGGALWKACKRGCKFDQIFQLPSFAILYRPNVCIVQIQKPSTLYDNNITAAR